MFMIEKILEPFGLSLGKKQDLATLLIHLRDNGVTTDEVIEHIEDLKKNIQEKQKKQNKERDRWNEVALKCPDCKIAMQLSPVNTHPANQVDKEFNSQWLCPKCWYDEYSKKTVREWIEEIGRQIWPTQG